LNEIVDFICCREGEIWKMPV